jgi:hypothetical protein
MEPGQTEPILRDMIRLKMCYYWKDSEPRAMAAWTSPTAHGGSINFVYTPPEFRKRGYAKAIVSGLANRMLQNGAWYCFILTDVDDYRTNKLYQDVGARTLCELLRCTVGPIVPKTTEGGGGSINAIAGGAGRGLVAAIERLRSTDSPSALTGPFTL